MNHTPPILFFGYVVILLMIFLVLPVWVIIRLKLSKWTKLLLGFNYFALLLTLFMQIGATGSLVVANGVAKSNLETLIRILRTEPPATVTAALGEYLAHDEGTYYLLAVKFPEPKENEPAPAPKADAPAAK